MLILFINSFACRLKIIRFIQQQILILLFANKYYTLCFMFCVLVLFIDCCGREWWVKIDLILAATKSPSAAVASPAKEDSKEGPDSEDQSSWSRRNQQRMNWIGLNDPWGAKCQSVPNFCAPFMSTLCSLLSISYSACATTGKLRNIIKQKKCMKLLIKVKLDFLTLNFNIHFSKPDIAMKADTVLIGAKESWLLIFFNCLPPIFLLNTSSISTLSPPH